VRPLPLDVFLLHAQPADDDGNVEIAGARGFDMPAVFAATRVLVTVEERVPRGQLGTARPFIVPRTFVDRVALAPYGAYPTSCLPHFPADLRALRRIVDADAAAPVPLAALEVSNQRRRALTARMAVPAVTLSAAVRDQASDHAPEQALAPAGGVEGNVAPSKTHSGMGRESPAPAYTVDELMAVVIARTIESRDVCSVGAASPLPTAAYMLAKHLHAPELLVMSHNGGLVDLPVRPLTLASAEHLDHQLAAAHTRGHAT
jgi:glutaconate CoA-transferase, subunit A